MEYKKKLFELPKRNIFQQIIGYLLIALSFVYIGTFYFQSREIEPFNWFMFIGWLFIGILQVIQGYGISTSLLFGKTYIIINEQGIILKKISIRKEKRINWDDIESIDYLTQKIILSKKNGTQEVIKHSLFRDKETVSEVIQVLANMAEEKGI